MQKGDAYLVYSGYRQECRSYGVFDSRAFLIRLQTYLASPIISSLETPAGLIPGNIPSRYHQAMGYSCPKATLFQSRLLSPAKDKSVTVLRLRHLTFLLSGRSPEPISSLTQRETFVSQLFGRSSPPPCSTMHRISSSVFLCVLCASGLRPFAVKLALNI
jgi:hypothetical protein